MNTKKRFLCPRCGSLSKLYTTALSRRDNETKICSGCGIAEAMFDLIVNLIHDDIKKKSLIEEEKAWLKCHEPTLEQIEELDSD